MALGANLPFTELEAFGVDTSPSRPFALSGYLPKADIEIDYFQGLAMSALPTVKYCAMPYLADSYHQVTTARSNALSVVHNLALVGKFAGESTQTVHVS